MLPLYGIPTYSMTSSCLKEHKKFACRMCTKAGYEDLLDTLQLLSLSNRRLFLKLCTLFKIVHGLCYFPLHAISTRKARSNKSRTLMLTQPFARTNSYFHSFIINSVLHWNSLPEHVISSCSFQQSLSNYIHSTYS